MEHNLDLSPLKLQDLAADEFSRLRRIAGGMPHAPNAILTPWPRLNQLTGGWEPGQFILVGARPAMGKTMFLLHIVVPLLRAGKHVFLHTLDRSVQSLFGLVLAVAHGLEPSRFRRGAFSPPELDALQADLATWPGTLTLSQAPTLDELEAALVDVHTQQPLDLVCQDFLQALVVLPELEHRQREMACITHTCKRLARNLAVPLVALSQLSRAPELRGGDKRPQLSDLRDSSTLEQDADQVLFLYRPEYYGFDLDDEGNSTRGLMEVILGKNTVGPCDTVRLFAREGLSILVDLQMGEVDWMRSTGAAG